MARVDCSGLEGINQTEEQTMVRIILPALLLLLLANSTVSFQTPTFLPVWESIPSQANQSHMQERLRDILIREARKGDMPPHLLVEMCFRESTLRFNARGIDDSARRKKQHRRTLNDYAFGVCQIKLATARWVWVRLVDKEDQRLDIEVWDLYDPVFNAQTAVILMKWLESRFRGWRPALAAYNEGPWKYLAKTKTYRLKKISQLSMGKGTYEMAIWMNWQNAKLKERMQIWANDDITLATVGGEN